MISKHEEIAIDGAYQGTIGDRSTCGYADKEIANKGNANVDRFRSLLNDDDIERGNEQN